MTGTARGLPGAGPLRAGLLRAGLLGAVATASGIALTATSGWLIVRASERPVILTLLTAIVAVRAFGMARPVFRYWERLRSHDTALADLAARRAEAYAGLVPLTPARLGRRGRADILAGVVDDLDEVVSAQVRVTVPLVSTALATLAATAVAWWLAPAAGAVVAALVVAVALVAWLALRLERRAQDELLAARAEVSRVAELVASHATELRAVGGEHTASGWVAEADAAVARASLRQSRGRALASGALLVSTGLATAAAAVLAGQSGLSGPMRALLVVLPLAVGDALSPVVDTVRSLARAQGSERRLKLLLAQRPSVEAQGTDPVAPGPPRLRLRGVTAAWAGSTPQLGPFDLDLEPGAHLAIVGANGCGKSTLLAVLARHLDPLGGTYAVTGADALTLDLEAVRGLFAVVDDDPHVFATSLRENLRLAAPAETTDGSLVAALHQAGLRDWLDGLPEGLDTRLGSGARGISGGERARLGLARALVSGRPVLLLDEPVAHLDHATAVAVLDDLLASTTGRTVVMATHRPEGLDAFDRVIDLSLSRVASPATVGW